MQNNSRLSARYLQCLKDTLNKISTCQVDGRGVMQGNILASYKGKTKPYEEQLSLRKNIFYLNLINFFRNIFSFIGDRIENVKLMFCGVPEDRMSCLHVLQE